MLPQRMNYTSSDDDDELTSMLPQRTNITSSDDDNELIYMIPQRNDTSSGVDDNELTTYSRRVSQFLLICLCVCYSIVITADTLLGIFYASALNEHPIYPNGFIASQHTVAYRLCLLPFIIIILDITMQVQWSRSKALFGTSLAQRANFILLVVMCCGFIVYLAIVSQIYLHPLPLLIWQLLPYRKYSKFHGQIFKIMKQDKKLGFIAINHYLCKLISTTTPISNQIPFHITPWKRLNQYLDDTLLSDKSQDIDQIISKTKNLMYFGLNRYLYDTSKIVICLVANINIFIYVYLNGHFSAYCVKFSMEICVGLLILIIINGNHKLKTLFIRGWNTSYFNEPYYSKITYFIDRNDIRNVDDELFDEINRFYERWRYCINFKHNPLIAKILFDKFGDISLIICDYLFVEQQPIKIEYVPGVEKFV